MGGERRIVSGEADIHESINVESQLVTIHDRVEAGDKAPLMKSLNSPPARGFTNPDPLRKRSDAKSAVGLKDTQDMAVYRVDGYRFLVSG